MELASVFSVSVDLVCPSKSLAALQLAREQTTPFSDAFLRKDHLFQKDGRGTWGPVTIQMGASNKKDLVFQKADQQVSWLAY